VCGKRIRLNCNAAGRRMTNSASKYGLREVSQSIAQSIIRSKYRCAFRKLLASGPFARKAFNDIVQSQARAEMKTFVSTDKQYPVLNGIRSVSEFSWTSLVTHLTSKLPTLSSVLTGAMTKKVQAQDWHAR